MLSLICSETLLTSLFSEVELKSLEGKTNNASVEESTRTNGLKSFYSRGPYYKLEQSEKKTIGLGRHGLHGTVLMDHHISHN